MSTTTNPPLTPQQRAALDAHARSVSLAAGAGCGKTFVLTERFITQLDPASAAETAELDQLVAITFTDAAAREMRDRIRRRCFQRLQSAADDAEAAAWQRLMRSMDEARISTIHAFCAALLRSHAVEAGLDPQFEVLDAAAADLLRLETVDDRLRTLLVDRNDDVLDLAAQRGLDRLRTDLADFSGPRNWAALERWRNQTAAQLVARWVQFFENKAPALAVAELLAAGEIHELRRLAEPDLAASDRLRRHLSQLSVVMDPEQIRRQPPGLTLATLRELARVQGVCSAKDWAELADYQRFKETATAVRELTKNSVLAEGINVDAANDAAELGLALVRVAADASAALEAAKARRNQLEFDDLLIRAHALLTNPAQAALRKRVVQRTRLLMVDEFQDTNPLQVEIIKAFCGERWQDRGLFAVGDFKQSIYRFNGAQPSVSTKLRADLPAAGRLSLTKNFRSQPAVLDFVNAVFHGAFADYEPLEPARLPATATPAVEFLWSPGPKTIDASEHLAASESNRRRKGAMRDARAEEARWIAQRLVQLLESPVPLVVGTVDGRPAPRRLQPGDVAILLRSLSDAQVYEEALREVGLDYYLAGGHAFYSQQEIFDVLNLLRAVASTVDEIALAGALRSPLFALADETLYWLVREHETLNAALAAGDVPSQLSKDEAAKARRAAATLDRLRREKDRLLVAELLALAWELTGYDATLLAEFLGPRKAANVEKLVEQARALDRNAPGDLPGFITQLSEFVQRTPKESPAATQAEGGDAIRIMTIHYAKGLEFPLVVLPDLARQRHGGGADPVLDMELGPLVPLPEYEGAIGVDLHRRLENAEDLEERKRLLYVACTRAADYLILSSSIDDIDRPTSDWLQLIDSRISLVDGELRGTLPAGAGYGVPHVRVITHRPQVEHPGEGQPRGADLRRLVAKTRELAKSSHGAPPPEALAIAPDVAARRRFSFSQLTGALTPIDREVQLPAPADEAADALDPPEKPTQGGGRELGTLVHAVLERLDYRRPRDIRKLSDFLSTRLVGHAPERAAGEAAAIVERFLQTPLAAQLSAAKTVRREVEFLLPWPPGQAAEGGPYLHGFIDCLFQDAAGRWHLVDYKTNRVAAGEVSRVVDLYDLQMLAYRLACERALEMPLAECTLVLLHPSVTHTLAWDAAAERLGIERITSAINQLTTPSCLPTTHNASSPWTS